MNRDAPCPACGETLEPEWPADKVVCRCGCACLVLYGCDIGDEGCDCSFTLEPVAAELTATPKS